MNEVLAQYPSAWRSSTSTTYVLITGGLEPIPQRIQDEVLATNPNVSMVMSGHYHDAYTRYDSFDEDGDGVEDRAVTQMLFDYQGLPEGGQGFLRLLQFDNEEEETRVRTYSPSLEQHYAEHPTLEPENPDFTISYETGGIVPRVKELSADAFRAEVLTGDDAAAGKVIGAESDVASSSEVTVEGTSDGGTYGWYVTATDEHGGEIRSVVREVTFVPATADTTAPELEVLADTEWIWPPNNKLVTVNTVVTATDDSGEEPTEEGKGHRGAIETVSDFRFRLRAAPKAEHTLTYEATDAAGNSSTESMTSTVGKRPKARG